MADEDHLDDSPGSWLEYRRLVLKELKRLDGNDQTIVTKLNDLDREIVMLKTRASMWGAVWGFAAALLVAVVASLVKS